MTTNNAGRSVYPDHLLVHPSLQHDPISKQGKVGFLTAVNEAADDFWVVFDDGKTGLYAPDALLMIDDITQIRDYLIRNPAKLSRDETGSLEHIALLHAYGGDESKKKALEMAAGLPKLFEAILTTVKSYQERFRSEGLGR